MIKLLFLDFLKYKLEFAPMYMVSTLSKSLFILMGIACFMFLLGNILLMCLRRSEIPVKDKLVNRNYTVIPPFRKERTAFKRVSFTTENYPNLHDSDDSERGSNSPILEGEESNDVNLHHAAVEEITDSYESASEFKGNSTNNDPIEDTISQVVDDAPNQLAEVQTHKIVDANSGQIIINNSNRMADSKPVNLSNKHFKSKIPLLKLFINKNLRRKEKGKKVLKCRKTSRKSFPQQKCIKTVKAIGVPVTQNSNENCLDEKTQTTNSINKNAEESIKGCSNKEEHNPFPTHLPCLNSEVKNIQNDRKPSISRESSNTSGYISSNSFISEPSKLKQNTKQPHYARSTDSSQKKQSPKYEKKPEPIFRECMLSAQNKLKKPNQTALNIRNDVRNTLIN